MLLLCVFGLEDSLPLAHQFGGAGSSHPLEYGIEYIFDFIKVNPFTFVPQVGGLQLTPLRAYAHQVPHYYIQNFGNPTSVRPSPSTAGSTPTARTPIRYSSTSATVTA